MLLLVLPSPDFLCSGRKTEKHKSFTAFVEIGGEKMPIGKVEKRECPSR